MRASGGLLPDGPFYRCSYGFSLAALAFKSTLLGPDYRDRLFLTVQAQSASGSSSFCSLTILAVPLNAMEAIQNVMDVEPVVPHKGIAS